MKIRTKICGFTRIEDALAAAELGVDAVGLIFYPGSKRFVDTQRAAGIARSLPPFVDSVALFVNADEQTVRETVSHVRPHILQFHGDEPAGFCRRFERPYIKAVRVSSVDDIVRAAEQYPDSSALLFDAAVPGQYGGTGQTFDWSVLQEDIGVPWILSGGLNPGNIAEAVRITRACAVDLCGGVESAPGIKDAGKMAALMEGIKRAELSLSR